MFEKVYDFETIEDLKRAAHSECLLRGKSYRAGQAVFNCLSLSNWSYAAAHFGGSLLDPFYADDNNVAGANKIVAFLAALEDYLTDPNVTADIPSPV